MQFRQIQQYFFFALLIGTTGIFLWMLGTYLFPVFWAVVIAIVFYPLYERILKYVRERASLAAGLSILAVILIVMVPLGIIGSMVFQESINLYHEVSLDTEETGGLHLVERASSVAVFLEPYGISREDIDAKIQEWSASLSQTIASSIVSFSQLTFSLLISTAIAFYLLFFFFRDGKKLRGTLLHYLPLGNAYEKRLFVRFTETTRAVVKGTLAISLLQGYLAGLTFWITGVSNPVLWGVAMALLAILPAVGPAIVWVPAGIILLISGSIWQGITILIVGTFLVSVVDEFLRPVLVGRGAKMPDAMILLATIGGLATFGISGFVVGPIIAAFFLSLWTMFEEQYSTELSASS